MYKVLFGNSFWHERTFNNMPSQSPRTAQLMQTPLFDTSHEPKSHVDQIALSYERARVIAKLFGMFTP